jgi:hypothetical protein
MNSFQTNRKNILISKEQKFGSEGTKILITRNKTLAAAEKIINSSETSGKQHFNSQGTIFWIKRNKTLVTTKQIMNSSQTNWSNIFVSKE